eukprot:c16682_g1_i1 orf=198-1718(-)
MADWEVLTGHEGQLVAAAAVVVVSFLLQLLFKRTALDENVFPRGPPGWPIVGHWPLLSVGSAREVLTDLSRNQGYGSIIGLRLGSRPSVVVSSAELARELLLTHDKIFANRPHYQFSNTLFYGFDSGVIFSSYGPHFSRLRKLYTLELFTAKRLQQLQYIRQEEVLCLLNQLRSTSQAINVEQCVASMSCDVTMRLLHSQTLAKELPELPELIRELEHASVPTLGDFIPWLKWLGLLQKGKLKRIHHHLNSIIESIILERRQLLKTTPSHNWPQDFLQVLLSKEKSEDDEERLTVTEIKAIILDILSGGIHTSSVTVEWAMSELIGNPRVLCKLRNEIDALKGKREELVTDEDVAKLPYLESVVKEVFRFHPVVPLLVPRISTKACKVGKYTLPRGTQAFVNVWAIGRDPEVWEKAEEFYPERFEGSEMDVKGQHYELLPFGSGRRICPGMRLGLSVVNVTVANLVRFFDWELPQGEKLDMSEKKGRGNAKATRLIAIPKPRTLSY